MNTDSIILDRVPIIWNAEQIALENNVRAETSFHTSYIRSLKLAAEVMRPRAVLRWSKVDAVQDGVVTIGGIAFKSKVMAHHLKDCEYIFACAMTAGDELRRSGAIKNEVLADSIQYIILGKLQEWVVDSIESKLEWKNVSFISPGSLPDWPIKGNKQVFALLGDLPEQIGIKLNANGYMRPVHSVSGVLFSDDQGYVNCRLCLRYDCIGRCAPFDKKEYDRVFMPIDQNQEELEGK